MVACRSLLAAERRSFHGVSDFRKSWDIGGYPGVSQKLTHCKRNAASAEGRSLKLP